MDGRDAYAMIRIGRVPPPYVAAVMAQRQDLLERAARASAETPESLIALGMTGNADCWVAMDESALIGLAFTQIIQGPKGRKLTVLAIGGERGARWLRQGKVMVFDDAKRRGAEFMDFIRITGHRTYFGMEPTGQYYEASL